MKFRLLLAAFSMAVCGSVVNAQVLDDNPNLPSQRVAFDLADATHIEFLDQFAVDALLQLLKFFTG